MTGNSNSDACNAVSSTRIFVLGADAHAPLGNLLSPTYEFSAVATLDSIAKEENHSDAQVVLLDVTRSACDVRSALHVIRERYESQPLIVVSSNADPAERRTCQARCADYVRWPVSARELSVRIDSVVRRTRSLGSDRAHFEAQLDAMRETANRSPIMNWISDLDGDIVFFNRRWYELTGLSAEQAIGMRWLDVLHPDDRVGTIESYMTATAERSIRRLDYRMRRADGEYRTVGDVAVPLIDSAGRYQGHFGSITEVHDRAEKYYTKALQDAEAQLRQAQKMEAIGHLTGGVAHDFNNLLTVVIGNLDSIQRHLPSGSSERIVRAARHAMHGAKRAANLTQRLLAFARRRALDPKETDLNALVAAMTEILTSTLGENIRIRPILGSALWRVVADPNQLENALLNLAVNARDAMPEGGELTIETSNEIMSDPSTIAASELRAGEYVLLSVRDSGIGMSKETLDRVFEPFFTTKVPGHGTGLGLSQVYGFVRQSGGQIKIQSEPGLGTSIKIYLPRSISEARLDHESSRVAVPEASAREAILVVEDEDAVRDYSCGVLRELGYRVVEAKDSIAALRLLERDGSIALLFADVGLPGLDGRKLAHEAQRLQPNLKVLFTTGHARDSSGHPDRFANIAVIGKPFTYADLAARVRAAIDN